MQNNEHADASSNESETLIKTPKQLIITVILGFLIPIITIVLLVRFVSFTSPMGAGSNAQTSDSIAERISPVAKLVFAEEQASDEEGAKTGAQVYESTCAACHTAGVAGAPKLGDAEAWGPLIDSGLDAMLEIALNGKGAMPARGGNSSLSDLEVERAVVYMANEAGASFEEPQDENGAEEASEEQVVAADNSQEESSATDQQETTAEESDEESNKEAADNEQESEEVASIDPAGEKLFNAVCATCHTAGVAGAPKVGSKEDWEPYIETGMDSMLEKSISGVGAMPPRGGSNASDDELKAAIEYMISQID